MWWHRKHDPSPADQERTIKAHLRKGDTLQITFDDRQLHIEGSGDLQLRIPAKLNVTAELRTTK